MGSDRARLSFDANQQYRSVIAQQGRVTLEADWNEAGRIADEERRAEAQDFVGASGTPDDGWAIVETGQVSNPPFDILVREGTMYAGGERFFLPAAATYNNQPEWLDASDDPDWVDPQSFPETGPGREFVFMILREQEVSAVEDTALRDVALGGPDTAARERIVRHFARLVVGARDCPRALAEAGEAWAREGLAFDPTTMRLLSPARLQVGFAGPQGAGDNCDPQAQGGYLGADNQLIRVQVSGFDPNTQHFRLAWGYDNASFLYRVDGIDDRTLRLQARPVDDFHQPRQGQAVEVLRATAQLANDEYLAATTGVMATLEVAYAPDTQQVTLPADAALDAEYLDPAQTPRLFLRAWEEEQDFTPGQPVVLTGTGLQVTLTAPNNGPFHVGDFWTFAVRPGTTADPAAGMQVYPPRYLAAPQPPEGPWLWAVPLAVIQWSNGIYTVLADCREQFDNLVGLTKRQFGGCCQVTVRPEDLLAGTSLQAIVDRFKGRDRVNICLMPGTYELAEPLVLGPEHSNLTLESCHDGAVLQVAQGKENNFLQGLIVLNHVDNVTLRRLRFRLPLVPFVAAGGKLGGLDTDATRRILGGVIDQLRVSIGIRPMHCALLTVEDCLFRFEIGASLAVFAAGIFAGSECWGTSIQRNRFVRDEIYLGRTQGTTYMLFGYVLAPTTTFATNTNTTTPLPAGVLVPTLVHDALFRDNLFDGLTGAVFIVATCGTAGFESNVVRRCHFGLWVLSMQLLASLTFLSQIAVRPPDLEFARILGNALAAAVGDAAVQIGSAVARTYPLPAGFDLKKAIPVPDPHRKVQRSAPTPGRLQELFDRALSAFAPAAFASRGGAVPGGTTPTGATSGAADVGGAATGGTITGGTATGGGTSGALSGGGTTGGGATGGSGGGQSTRIRRQPLGLDAVAAAGLASTTGAAPLFGRVSLFEAHALAQAGGTDGLSMALRLADNEIDAHVDKLQSSIGLFIGDDLSDTTSTLTMTGNRVRNSMVNGVTALILMVHRASVAGNLILNESVSTSVIGPSSATLSRSLMLLPGGLTGDVAAAAGVTVTGNTLAGPPLLPPRPAGFPAPLDRWEIFNALL